MNWPTSKLLAVDTETTGLQVWSPRVQPTVVSWWLGDSKGSKGFGSVHRLPEVHPKLKRRLLDPSITKLFWNAKFDIPILRKAGLYLKGPIIDCMVMHQIQFPGEKKHDLKSFSRKELRETYLEETELIRWMRKNMPKDKRKVFGLAPDHILFPYALKDAECTYYSYLLLRHFFSKHKQWHVLRNEMKFLHCVLDMEEVGVPIDIEEVQNQMESVQKELARIKAKLCKMAGNPSFNPNSHDQVRELVYDGTIMPKRWTSSGKAKTDELSVLEQPTETGRLVVRFRKLSKAYKTYLVNFAERSDEQNILHPSINQAGARTGRISCSEPNLTNLPRPDENEMGRIRNCIASRPGYRLLFIDYEQLEVRIFADYIQEPHMLKAIRSGEDLHGTTCRRVFRRQLKEGAKFTSYRYYAKKLNLAKQYFIGPDKYRDTVLLDTGGKVVLTLEEAYSQVRSWDAAHPRFKEWYEGKVLPMIAETGGVTTRYGRYLPVDPTAPYIGVNYLVQGTAADLVKTKMLKLRNFLKGKKTKMILQVHDEVIFLLHQEEKHIVPQLVKIMEEHNKFSVPITCSVQWGKRWGRKKKWEKAA